MTSQIEALPRIPDETLEHVARLLRVLGHPQRLRLIELLAEGERAVGELAQVIGIAPNACSQHLNMMRAHGLLGARREGKVMYYRVIHLHALGILACIRMHTGDG